MVQVAQKEAKDLGALRSDAMTATPRRPCVPPKRCALEKLGPSTSDISPQEVQSLLSTGKKGRTILKGPLTTATTRYLGP